MINILYIKIGPVCIKINSQYSLTIDPRYQHFFIDDISEENDIINCDVKVTDDFSVVQGNLIYQNGERMIFDYQGKETRIHFFNQNPYGIYREIDDNHFSIEVTSNIINILFLEMFALEKYLLKKGGLILHSSFIEWHNQGIVFTAPSGTGKSTQASLWQKYEHAKIINGDRSILYFNKNNILMSCGLPFCGSSNINLNKEFPLKAIVFLSQADYNEAEYVNISFASKKLFKESSINKWNIKSIDDSLNIIEKITKHTKLISLKCMINQEAVNILKDLIIK